MKPILVMYATREGQTRRVAEHLGHFLATDNCTFDLQDAAHILPGESAVKSSVSSRSTFLRH